MKRRVADDASCSIVLVSCGNAEEADAIASGLVREKCAACVTVIPHARSVFFWKNRITRAREHILFIKTLSRNFKRVEKIVRSLHSYEVPEIVMISIERGSASYMKWIRECVSCEQ